MSYTHRLMVLALKKVKKNHFLSNRRVRVRMRQ